MTELHELIDDMTPVQAKVALQTIASYCQDDGATLAGVVKDDIAWIIEEAAANFDGLVETFENRSAENEPSG